MDFRHYPFSIPFHVEPSNYYDRTFPGEGFEPSGFPYGPPQGGFQPGSMPGQQMGFPPGMQPGFPPGQQPGFPPGQQPGFPPGQQPGFPPGQQPGFPPGQQLGFPPGQQPGFPPGQQTGGGQQGGPPSTPPPSFTPQMQQVSTFAVDPGAIRRCLYRFTYMWLNTGRSFWFYPVFVGRTSIAGWRWRRNRWVYFGTELNSIRSFQCV